MIGHSLLPILSCGPYCQFCCILRIIICGLCTCVEGKLTEAASHSDFIALGATCKLTYLLDIMETVQDRDVVTTDPCCEVLCAYVMYAD